MHQKGVKVFGGATGKKLDRGYLDFDKAEFSLFVGRVADVGCWHSGNVVVNHRVKKVLQGGGA